MKEPRDERADALCEIAKIEALREKIRESVNMLSLDNTANTPDYIIADFLIDAFKAWVQAHAEARKHNGDAINDTMRAELRNPKPGWIRIDAETSRMKVPGGWIAHRITKDCYPDGSNPMMSESMAYIPDKEGIWPDKE